MNSDSNAPHVSTEPRRLPFIDGIRALAALYVVLCHAYYEPSSGYYEDKISKVGKIINHLGLTYGPLAVAVFIVVSGFCLGLPIAKRHGDVGSVPEFFRRRIRRIVPPYLACLIFSSLFILLIAHEKTGTVWDYCLPLTWHSFWTHALLVHNLLGRPGEGVIGYHLWSIAVEAQIYLLFPLIALGYRKIGWVVTSLALYALGIGVQASYFHQDFGSRVWFVGLFGFGAASAWLSVRDKSNRQWLNAGLLIGALTLVSLIKVGKHSYEAHQPYFDTLIGLSTALILGFCYSDHRAENIVTRMLSWEPLEKVGLYSYSIYLMHAPLLHLEWLVLNRLIHPSSIVMMFLLIAATPLTVWASYRFFLVFEKPFFTKRRQALASPG